MANTRKTRQPPTTGGAQPRMKWNSHSQLLLTNCLDSDSGDIAVSSLNTCK